MGQVAFDTQEFVETLENAGLPKEQAKAISIAVRKSHEVADVATKRDLEDVRKEIDTRFDKLDAKIDSQISLVRKDLQLEMSGIRAEQKLMRWMLGAGILGILSLVVKAFLMPAL
ncbi:hypothetical protein QE197_09810 [Arsenophonus nasoniae]|uniref:DUF1640 domain-containing protein n=1 Tax=Arsenophonus nasoniae TaxID=638 RepID=A0A4P7KUS9_9GAMM|nr:hypothetical protein [Arsenophonus nasoniae]QBY43741.1 hypothetical protein ArsFIN_23100 [Arsenophonus nasoniae]WGM06833.1 hypothetical protein QE258_05970 [Arsenophonus nasoniae]WGM12527.1 hypothetical protein QE197_09810 [Arsenophonus nasoniae]WGM17202.1 hypothetical protein QE193_09695 [Arsenophonus nasoniae]